VRRAGHLPPNSRGRLSVHLVHPAALAALLLVPAIWYWERRGESRAVTRPRLGPLLASGIRSARWRGRIPDLLRIGAAVLLVLALARPRTEGGVIEERTEGVPIAIAFDISSSMLAEDFAPDNRLEVARRATREFVAMRPHDPIALIAFAGEAITQVPLTTDRRVLFAAIGNLRIGLLEDGTAIGMGLATALTRLQGVDAADRVVVLLSDGENNRGEIEPMEAALAASGAGVRVYTVGVGTDSAAPVPLRRAPDGAVLQYAELPVGIDEPLLREIAATTGGAYFRADSPDALDGVYAELARLVPSPVEIRRSVEYREWYPLLVVLGALALLIEWLVRGSRWGRIP
jgi:Ca-activated chloride channel homolog